jgi:hypothetical protein
LHRGARGSGSAMALEEWGLRGVRGTGYRSESEASSSESMSGGSGSSSNVGASLGRYFPPVNVKAPDSLRNSVRAAIPLGVPRSSGRAISLSPFCRLSRWFCSILRTDPSLVLFASLEPMLPGWWPWPDVGRSSPNLPVTNTQPTPSAQVAIATRTHKASFQAYSVVMYNGRQSILT